MRVEHDIQLGRIGFSENIRLGGHLFEGDIQFRDNNLIIAKVAHS